GCRGRCADRGLAPGSPARCRRGGLTAEERPELASDRAHPVATVPAVSDVAFRNAMSRLASGVTVLTCLDPMGRDCALTVTAVTSVSRDPALVLVCVKQDGFTHDAMSVADGWVLNMLGTEALDL